MAAVQTAVNSASTGDTVQVPAGTATWTGTLTVNADIAIIGAGIGQTIITNNVVGTMINWTTASNGFCRLSGLDFEAGPPDASPDTATKLIYISGTCHAFRMDNCEFNGINEYNLWFAGWVYGVIDHCTFNLNASPLVEVQYDAYSGQQYGDGSWADVSSFGTTNQLYFENDVITQAQGSNAGMLDGDYGERVCVRYCNITNSPVGSHGTDNGGRIRGMRSYEIYENNFQYQTNGWPVFCQCVLLRSGTALIWSNTIWGGYEYIAHLQAYRTISVNFSPFNNVSGANPWDSNSVTVFDSGTATGTNNSPILTDSSKNWTVNQWVGSTYQYVLYDVTQGLGALITANTATTITFNGSFQGYTGNNPSGSMLINNGDTYQIRPVYATLDQPGFGKGDLLTGSTPVNSTTGTAAWPHEVPDPVYEWANNFTFAVSGYPSGHISASPTVLSGRDYFVNTPKPGYAPLVYPHPLVSGTNAPPPPSFTLTVVNGAGSGSYGSNSVVSISAITTSNLIFANWSGLHIANTNSASTTVTMPASNLTVSAKYVPPLPPTQLPNTPGP